MYFNHTICNCIPVYVWPSGNTEFSNFVPILYYYSTSVAEMVVKTFFCGKKTKMGTSCALAHLTPIFTMINPLPALDGHVRNDWRVKVARHRVADYIDMVLLHTWGKRGVQVNVTIRPMIRPQKFIVHFSIWPSREVHVLWNIP